MNEPDRTTRPIRIVARRRPLPLGLAESTRHRRESPPLLAPDAAPSAALPPGSPDYCSWDLESCLRYWM